MKFLMSFLLLISVNAFANPIFIDIGGIRHQCTPVENGNTLDCVKLAYSGVYSKEEAFQLCSGSSDKSPAECGTKAYRGRYSKSESIQLCIGARTSTGPSDCADLVYSGPFSKEESIEVCQNNGTTRNATCALEAYRGPFSREEAVKMCKTSRYGFDKSKSMRSERQYSKVELMELIKETNIKAFENKDYK